MASSLTGELAELTLRDSARSLCTRHDVDLS